MSVTFTTQSDLNTGQQYVASNVGPGDAVYARVVDGSNWWRIRLRSTTRFQTSAYTEYLREERYYQYLGEVEDGILVSNNVTFFNWYPSSAQTSGPVVINSGYTYVLISSNLTDVTRTTNFDQPYSSYQLVVEVSVVDAITVWLTSEIGTVQPTRLSILALDTRLVFESNADHRLVVDSATHQAGDIAANGTAGPSDVTASALGGFSAIAQIHAPNAPVLVSPAASAVVDANLDIVLVHQFSDDDTGDSQTAKRVRIRVNGGSNQWWNGVALVGTEQTLTSALQTTNIPGGVLDNGDTVQWAVSTRDRDNQWGSYAAESLFSTADRPMVVILEPDTGDVIDTSSMLVSWDKTNSFVQSGYRIIVIDRALQDVANFDLLTAVKTVDTGVVAGAQQQAEVEGYPLTFDAATYLQVYSVANGTSDWVIVEPDVRVRPPAPPTLSAVYVPELAATVVSLFAQGNLLSDDSASLVSTVGGWVAEENAVVEWSTETVANDRGGVLKVTAVEDGDVVIALAEEPIPVRVEEALTLLAAAKHGGSAALVDIGVRFVNPVTGATIAEHWVTSVEEESGPDPEIPDEEPEPDPDPEVPFVIHRINAGGLDSASDGTNTYEPDAFFVGGTPYAITEAALLAALPAAFQTSRYGMVAYRIPAARRARILLHMVEPTFTQPGQRVFSISVDQGSSFGYAVVNLDLFATVGRGVDFSKEIVADPVGGFVTLAWTASLDNPIVAGIEVLEGVDSLGELLPLTGMQAAPPPFTAAVVYPVPGTTVASDPIMLTVNTVPLNSPFVAAVEFFRQVDTVRTSLGTVTTRTANGWQLSVPRSVFGDGAVTVNADVIGVNDAVTQTVDVTFISAPGGQIIVDPNGVQAYQSNHFAKTMGVATHGEGGSLYFSALRDIRFKTVRGSGSASHLGPVIRDLANLEPDLEWIWWTGGFGGNWIPQAGSPASIRDTIKAVNNICGRKVVTMLELANEPDDQMALDGGAQVRQYALDIRNTMRADPATAHLRIFGPSLYRVWDNVSFQRLGYVGDRVDASNLHNYTGDKIQMTDAYLTDLINWSSINMGPNPNARDLATGYTKIVATELGYSAPSGTGHPQPGQPNQDARAILINRIYLEHWRVGIGPTWIYELFNQPWKPQWESEFGFLNDDGSWREVAHSTKAWIEIHSDPGPSFTPGKLAYQLEGANSLTKHFLVQKRNGSFYLNLWQQQNVTDASGSGIMTIPTPVNITVRLTRTAAFRNFVPNSASRANAIGSTVTNVDNYATTSSARPRVIEIVPA